MTTLEAGRELDVMVAEKIFAAKVWNRDGVLWMTRHDPHQVLPPYSTDIAAAWQVAEKLHLWILPSENGGWCAGRMEHDSHLAPYIDTVGGRVDGAFDYIECAPTVALAICRAALAAIESHTGTPSRPSS